MAKIVIDSRMYNESGIGRYLRNLIEELQKLDKNNEYYILHLKTEYDRLAYHTKNFHKVLADFKWYTLQEQIRLPRILKRINADLVHFPHFNVSYLYRGKFLVTIHDMIHKHYQMRRATTHDLITYKLKHLGYKTIFRKAVNGSVKIITPSEFVKKQLIDELKVEGSKIMVTPEGVEDNLSSIGNNLSSVKSHQILEKLGVKTPYIFYVGNAHPHKNVEGLIEAFKETKENGLQLVLAGNDHYFWHRIKMNHRFRRDEIVYTGFVSDEELVALYKNARCFVMPSFEEGFGIPIFEAMILGCPVVASNAGSLKEVGGDAALYFNPHNLGDMGDRIDRVLKSERLRQELIKKGKMRVKKFSWKKMTEQTLEVYSECV